MNNDILRKAKAQLKHCTVKQARVVAIVSNEHGRPLFAVSNRRKNNGGGKWTYHAEELAVNRIMRWYPKPKYLTMTVVRFKADGSLGMAKPCPECYKKVGVVNHLYYTDDSGTIQTLF